MSKRIAGIALTLALFMTGANAEIVDHARYMDADETVLPIGESGWELFRPEGPAQTPFDLNYLTYDLLPDSDALGLRFHSSLHLTIDLEIDPFTHEGDLIGPIYDMSIGATRLALRFSF